MPSYEFFIAKRYLRSKRRTKFISLITYISVGGVAVGVAALVIVLSLMNGFAGEVRNKLIGMDAHIRVGRFHGLPMSEWHKAMEKVKEVPHVVGVSPFVYGEAMLASKGVTAGVAVKGVDEATVDQVSDLGRYVVFGEMLLEPPEGPPGVVLGVVLADRLRTTVGDTVYMATPQSLSPALLSVPRLHRFRVVGIFESGFYEFDASLAVVSLRSAQTLFGIGDAVTGLEVKTDDPYRAESVKQDIIGKLGYPYYVRTWAEMRRHLFSWMTIEKWSSFIVLSLIILVAAFNIASTLIMMVLEKTKEIGILKSMGATARSIGRIFMFEGLVVGTVGTGVGAALGALLCFLQEKFKLISLPPDIYIINAVPIDMRIWDFIWVSAASVGICFLASLYPARRAAALDPVEAIRYE